jgi:hypothetical protein
MTNDNNVNKNKNKINDKHKVENHKQTTNKQKQ